VATPDDSRITVLAKGKCRGFRVSIPFGGHTAPIVTAGAILLWKNAQKNAKKNITSDVMNKIIPKRRPFCTILV
jgi:hypothetical protein